MGRESPRDFLENKFFFYLIYHSSLTEVPVFMHETDVMNANCNERGGYLTMDVCQLLIRMLMTQ